MTMQVDWNRCTGCGHCLEVCPTGAIRLVGGVVAIEGSLCQGCKACLEVCPTGAIFAGEEVTGAGTAPALAQMPAPARIADRRPAAGILPVLGAALAFVGREVVPRVVAALLERQERRAGLSAASTGQGHRYRKRLRRRRRPGREEGDGSDFSSGQPLSLAATFYRADYPGSRADPAEI